ncbi:NAD(P) transhydrogenase subunit alpha [Alphaproteobacteria bacterium]|nr:NAD(P) transhydrogenase subunit alpha [Alphaproteobacteria bacterium]
MGFAFPDDVFFPHDLVTSTVRHIAEKSTEALAGLEALLNQVKDIQSLSTKLLHVPAYNPAFETFVASLAIFLLACVVGYYVVWNVTPALHSPLMAVTNAISSVIIIGAILGFSYHTLSHTASCLSFLAIVLASINIFGGFFITQRMLDMLKKRK